MKIKINGVFYEFFNNVSINFNLDSVASTFSFSGLFDTNNPKHREIFKPLSYNKIEFFNNLNDLILTGVILNTDLTSSSKNSLQKLSGYSLPGVLEDSTIPYSSYPLEKNNVTLTDIATLLLGDFDISFEIDSTVQTDMNIQYKKTVASASESIKNYLSKLASQRNIVISHNSKGDLIFFRPNINSKSKAFFNKENTLSMSLRVNGQSFHSEISVIRQPEKNNSSLIPVDTVQNILVNAKRTKVTVMSSGTSGETRKAADNIMASELKNISLTLSLNYIPLNVSCGDIVEVENSEISIYNRQRMIVSSISINIDSKSEKSVLKLLIPESFTGETPKNIFDYDNI